MGDDTDGYLAASWWTDGDDTGRLTIEAVSSTGFAGRSSAWFNGYAVVDFADRLTAFPLSEGEPPSLVGGLQPIGGELHVQVGLAVYPVYGRGQVAFGIELATEQWDWPEMRPGESEAARFELWTTYQRLGVFAADLRGVVNEGLPTAHIAEERLR